MRRLSTLLLASLCLVAAGRGSAMQLDLTSPDARLEQARSFYHQARFDDAIAVLRELIETLDALGALGEERLKLADAHFLLGLNYAAVQADDRARENFAISKVLDPERELDPEIYAPRVVALFLEAGFADQAAGKVADTADAGLEIEAPKGGGATNLARGTRVRASLDGGGATIVGNVLRLDAGSVTLVDEAFNQVEIPADRITRLEVSTGKRSRTLMGALVGAAMGAAIGAVETPDTNCVGEGCFTRGENIGYGALGMGLVGGVVGAFIKTDRWVELPSGLGVQVGARRGGGAEIALVLSF